MRSILNSRWTRAAAALAIAATGVFAASAAEARPWHYYRGGWYGNPSWALGTFAGVAAGAAIASSYYHPYPYGYYYPPAYYAPPAYGYGSLLGTGLMWGVGIAAAGALYSSWNWGRGAGYVNVNANRAVNVDRNFDRSRYTNNNRWQHDAGHRRGVAYRDQATRQQFGQNRPGADQRQQFRGQVANRPQGGAGIGQGQRPNIGQGGQRPNIGQGGQRANLGQGGQRPNIGQGGQRVQNRGNFPQGNRPSALSGVNRGQQVNREAARGRVQQNRAQGNFNRGGGGRGGGGGMRAGGGGSARGGGGRGGGRR